MNKTLRFVICILVFAFTASSLSYAKDSSKKMTLAQIMSELSKSVQKITDGIYTEDFKKITAGAEYISNHPKPMNMKAVVGTIGKDMGAFKAMDHVVHHAAVEIKKAAASKDLAIVLSETNKMMVGCLGCHTTYKARVKKVTGKK